MFYLIVFYFLNGFNIFIIYFLFVNLTHEVPDFSWLT